METYVITGDQWEKINSALLVAAMVCLMKDKQFHQQMLDASFTMDEIVNGPLPDDED